MSRERQKEQSSKEISERIEVKLQAGAAEEFKRKFGSESKGLTSASYREENGEVSDISFGFEGGSRLDYWILPGGRTPFRQTSDASSVNSGLGIEPTIESYEADIRIFSAAIEDPVLRARILADMMRIKDNSNREKVYAVLSTENDDDDGDDGYLEDSL